MSALLKDQFFRFIGEKQSLQWRVLFEQQNILFFSALTNDTTVTEKDILISQKIEIIITENRYRYGKFNF